MPICASKPPSSRPPSPPLTAPPPPKSGPKVGWSGPKSGSQKQKKRPYQPYHSAIEADRPAPVEPTVMDSRAEPIACRAPPGSRPPTASRTHPPACPLHLPIASGTSLFRPPRAFRRMGPRCRCRPAARCRVASRTPAIPGRSRSRNQGVETSPRCSAEVGSRPTGRGGK